MGGSFATPEDVPLPGGNIPAMHFVFITRAKKYRGEGRSVKQIIEGRLGAICANSRLFTKISIAAQAKYFSLRGLNSNRNIIPAEQWQTATDPHSSSQESAVVNYAGSTVGA